MATSQGPIRPYQPRDYPPQLRATDADREAVAEVVRSAVVDGRLSLDELDLRLQSVYGSKTHGDLAQQVSDLVLYRPPMRMSPQPMQEQVSERKVLPGFLLCLFLGGIGIHRFYAGKIGSGVAMLLITVLTLGFGLVVTSIWALVDLIVLATGSFRDGDGRRMRDWT